ncbi:hypothetical protein D3C76_1251470 [compost metagenome]
MQCLADFLGGVTLQAILGFRVVQHVEITHQKQSGDVCCLHAIDERIHCQHLLDRAGHDGFFHVFAIER